MSNSHLADPLTPRARQLRRDSTDAEKKLWNCLRNRQLGGYKFRRQYPIAGYILDFACEELRLAVELDGGHHNDVAHTAHDAKRTEKLVTLGWRVLRFWNNEVLENTDGVLLTILSSLTRNHDE